MNRSETVPPTPARRPSEMRVALVSAGLMLAIPLAAKLATRFGWVNAGDLAERSLMVILAGLIVFTGNTIPKRLVPPECLHADAAGAQAFLRFAGWTWVLTGIAFGLACLLLPRAASTTATLVVVPLGMALIAYRWIRMVTARRRAA